MLKKGDSVYEVYNYYDNNALMKIDVDPALTPTQNAQKYYKEYDGRDAGKKSLYWQPWEMMQEFTGQPATYCNFATLLFREKKITK